MIDEYLAALLGKLIADATITKLKLDRNQHWERELEQEAAKICATAKDIYERAKAKR